MKAACGGGLKDLKKHTYSPSRWFKQKLQSQAKEEGGCLISLKQLKLPSQLRTYVGHPPTYTHRISG